MTSKYGSRRFIMVMGCAIVSTGLVYLGKIDGGEFVALVSLTVVPYLGFNTQQHINLQRGEK